MEEATEALRADDELAPYVEEYGPLTLEPAENLYERLVVSLIRQQVSMAAGEAIQERLFERFEVTPAGMQAADEAGLRDVGLSSAKVEYVKSAASVFAEREFDASSFEGMDNSTVVEELTAIHGVGPWTAKMALIFGLGRPDVFPVEDLGIRRGMELVCDREMTRAEMRSRASEWKPYRSYASLYLWKAYEG